MAEPLVAQNPDLRDLVEKIVARADPVAIYLFGSRARGDHAEDSDYDLLIVVDDAVPPEKVSPQEAYHLVEGRRIPVDVLMARRSTFLANRNVIGTLSNLVWAEGKLLHARDEAGALV